MDPAEESHAAAASTSRRSASSSRSNRDAEMHGSGTGADAAAAAAAASSSSIKTEDGTGASAVQHGHGQLDAADEDAAAEEEQADASGESSKSTASRTRSKKGSNKGRRGGRASASQRSRSAKASRSAEPGAMGNDDDDVEAQGNDVGRQRVVSEGADVKDEAEASTAIDDAGYASDQHEHDEKQSRRRSASGLKELAGLGLKTLGDGAGEPLQPRRSRRAAVSPNQEQSIHSTDAKEEDDMDVDQQHSAAGNGADEGLDDQSSTLLPSGPVGAAGDDASGFAVVEEDAGEEGITRCLCGSADENVGLMIQCETCKCWQHCICMGMQTEEECPDVYYCEQCRPELHIPLLRMLGVFHPPRSHKKGGGKSRSAVKDASKELREAKEAVLTLAKENERRAREGREVVTGWSVAQRQDQDRSRQIDDASDSETMAGGVTNDAQMTQGNNTRGAQSSSRRSVAIESSRLSRSASRDEPQQPKSPPKRRSTMNSRESVYGWEPIPPGLLNEDEVWDEKDERSRRRRRGVGKDEESEQHTSTEGTDSVDAPAKVARGSQAAVAADDGDSVKEDDEEEQLASSLPSRRAQPVAKKGKDSDRPKHPNQYTKRAAAAAAAATNAAGERSSPSPSPNKRHVEGIRRSAREAVASSRMGTPVPGDGIGRSSHTGQGWGLPEHLAHLSYLLPPSSGPESLKVDQHTVKGSGPRNNPSNATRDPDTDHITRASPQPYSTVSLTEAPTKVRYPGKRMTMGEMRKRVRNILDFVSRLQVESVERERRMRMLGIVRDGGNAVLSASVETSGATTIKEDNTMEVAAAESAAAAGAEKAAEEEHVAAKAIAEAKGEASPQTEEGVDAASTAVKAVDEVVNADTEMADASGAAAYETISHSNLDEAMKMDVNEANGSALVSKDKDANASSAVPPAPGLPAPFRDLDGCSSMELVDELTRELMAFQQRFGTGLGAAAAAAAAGSH